MVSRGNGGITPRSALRPEISRADARKSLAGEIVLEEARPQVRADAFHFEPSIYDHVCAIDFVLHAAVLANLNQLATADEFEKTLAILCVDKPGWPEAVRKDVGVRSGEKRASQGFQLRNRRRFGSRIRGLAGSIRRGPRNSGKADADYGIGRGIACQGRHIPTAPVGKMLLLLCREGT